MWPPNGPDMKHVACILNATYYWYSTTTTTTTTTAAAAAAAAAAAYRPIFHPKNVKHRVCILTIEYNVVVNPCNNLVMAVQKIVGRQTDVSKSTWWLHCVECPQYGIRLEALGYVR